MSVFHQFVIDGLLQTEDYARAMLSVVLQDKELEAAISRRVERQAILDCAKPLWKAQLARLLDDMERPNVTLQIIPDRKVYLEPFRILSFDGRPDLVYADVAVGPGQFYDDPNRMRAFKILFSRIRSLALPVDASAALIRDVMEQMS